MPDFSLGQLWLNALGIIPVALLAIIVCRVFPARPSTRHLIWLAVLAMFLAPSFVVGWLPHEARRDPAAYLGATHANDQRTVARAPRDEETVAPVDQSTTRATQTPQRESAPRPGLPASESPLTRLITPGRKSDASSPVMSRSHDAAAESPSPSARRVLKPADSLWLAGIVEPVVRRAVDASRAADAAVREEPAFDALPERMPSSVVVASPRLDASSVQPSSDAWRPAPTTGDASRPGGVASLLAVRDAVAALPPVPAPAWITGMAIMVAVMLVRVLAIARLVRRGVPACRSVRQMVERAARDVGLGLPPDVVMVSDRVSPMMWCGRRPVLVLPAGLWSQLDGAGRYAVICHELAHLRRLDHWVCWFDLVVGVVFWWHPLAWWVRRQVREEADLCCDAWVTHLQPARRRAYAQALLDSRKYLSAMPLAGPAVGLGTATPRARRFARRLTMVMTREFVPRRSIRGVALAGALTAAGLLVSPIAACPPEEGKSLKDARPTTTLASPVPAFFGGAAQAAPGAGSPASADSTFEQFMRERAAAPETGSFEYPIPAELFFMGDAAEAHDDVEARLRRLEERLERLMQAVERLHAGQQGVVGGVTTPAPPIRPVPPAEPAPRGQGGATAPQPPIAPTAVRSHGGAGAAPGGMATTAAPAHPGHPAPLALPPGIQGPGGAVTTAQAPRAGQAPGGGGLATSPVATAAELFNADGPILARTYRLPKGKLKELVELMIRDDVPVRVAPREDAIEVHATEGQHRIFRMFIELIHPEASSSGSAEAESRRMEAVIGQMAALEQAEAARLRDVAARRSRQLESERAAVESLTRDHAALARQKELIAEGDVRLRTHHDQLARAAAEIEAHRITLRDQASSLEGDRGALIEELRRSEMALRDAGAEKRAEEIARVTELKARVNATDAAVRSTQAARQSLEAQLKTLQAEIKRVEQALSEMAKEGGR